MPDMPGPLRRQLTGWGYDFITFLDRGEPGLTLMNYGYAAPDDSPSTTPYDPLHCRQQLYHHLAEAVPLEGRRMLEVGSGRGGGASYVMATFHPASLVGVDLSPRAVRFCRRRYSGRPGLSFQRGRAEALPFPDASFDAVLNVESSHGYARMDHFLREVTRVLRPGGRFLWTDFRLKDRMPGLREALKKAGFLMERERLITECVVAALDQDEAYKDELIERKVPRWLRRPARVFGGMRGTTIYESFKDGGREYWSFILRAPSLEHPSRD